jgi:hypothetical protein
MVGIASSSCCSGHQSRKKLYASGNRIDITRMGGRIQFYGDRMIHRSDRTRRDEYQAKRGTGALERNGARFFPLHARPDERLSGATESEVRLPGVLSETGAGGIETLEMVKRMLGRVKGAWRRWTRAKRFDLGGQDTHNT